MELKQLRTFTVVAEELHFGRAAERLHTAQPALSAQVRNLENELGVKLFFRTTRSVSLTRAGEAFLPEARAALAQAQSAVNAARRMADEGSELLKLAGVDSATAGLLPSVVRSFRRDYPDAEIKITEMLSAPALHNLANRQIDIAFSRVEPVESGLCSRLVLREPIVAVLPKGHRLARRKRLGAAHLSDQPLVIPSRSHRPILFDYIHNFFRAKGFEPRILQEANERHMIISMVAAGLGVSLVPAWVVAFARDDVVFRPLKDGLEVDVYAVWRENEALDSVPQFLDYLPAV